MVPLSFCLVSLVRRESMLDFAKGPPGFFFFFLLDFLGDEHWALGSRSGPKTLSSRRLPFSLFFISLYEAAPHLLRLAHIVSPRPGKGDLVTVAASFVFFVFFPCPPTFRQMNDLLETASVVASPATHPGPFAPVTIHFHVLQL